MKISELYRREAERTTQIYARSRGYLEPEDKRSLELEAWLNKNLTMSLAVCCVVIGDVHLEEVEAEENRARMEWGLQHCNALHGAIDFIRAQLAVSRI